MKTFIETQFPVSKVSKESYKERKANYSQTLTGLGKWWGRKPLILVRATILGLLLPATNNPKKDREIFLKILTMDEEGLWLRKSKSISLKDLYNLLTPKKQEKWFSLDSTENKPKYKKGIKKEEKEILQKIIFNRLSYDEKLEYCDRPEHINNLPQETWQEINNYLGTSATNLSELIQELGKQQFGHIPRVGDAFCGGGSIPFEAARIGCEAYGSDLNPVATLLTWAALNIVGGGEEVAKQVREIQQQVYAAVDEQITAWGIEHNKEGWRADAYLYCNETHCPECGWMVPLAPSWVIGEKTKTVAQLSPSPPGRGARGEGYFDIVIKSGVSSEELKAAKEAGTVKDSYLKCPHCSQSTPMQMIRGDRRGNGGKTYGLRLWENGDLVPRPDDIFQERLYCIRWVLPSSPNPFSLEEKGNNKNEDGSPLLPGEGRGGEVKLLPTEGQEGKISQLAGRERKIPDILLERAKELRKQATSAEKLLWECLRNRQLNNAKFRRQHNIACYIADFYCHEARLVIELDGEIHNQQVEKDSIRDKWMQEQGFTVLRFPNEVVFKQTEQVLKTIAGYLPSSPREKGDGGVRSDSLPGEGQGVRSDSLPEEGRGGEVKRLYCAPISEDLEREKKVLELLKERFEEWQEKGYIPSRKIEPGDKTDEPIRTRGWTHWHHLFNPRQLLMLGLILEKMQEIQENILLNRNKFRVKNR